MNFVAEAISRILDSPNFELRGEPTNEDELNKMYYAINYDENGNQIESNNPSTFGFTWSQVSKKVVEIKAEYDAKQYQRDRAVAYDPIPEQLDQIYHDIDGWKARIKAVKDKFPKP